MTKIGEPLLERWPSGTRLVLGSRSPRRLELLQQVFPAEAIEVTPPRSAEELGFEGLDDWPVIESRLNNIARMKCEDVLEQVSRRSLGFARIVIAADTVVVARGDDRRLKVLGQPPEDSSRAQVVAGWFRDLYLGKTHTVATSLCIGTTGNQVVSRVVTSDVTFRSDVDGWVDTYAASDEPSGKAGGYAIQGAGSLFVSRVEGSLTNVVGLPLAELLELLESLTEGDSTSLGCHC